MIDPCAQAFLWLFAAPFIAPGFAGLVLLAWAENFAHVGWATLTLRGYGADRPPRRWV